MNEPEIQFTFDGRRCKARKGDMIASALYRSGVKVLTRSIKFHRPRGLHCGTGDCPNCLVNVNGIPNVRSCITPVMEGMAVRSQNRIVSLRLDPVSLIDHLFKRGFNYHHRFIRPAFAKRLYQSMIRRMAGIGEVPSAEIAAESIKRIKTDVLIIGEGRTASHIKGKLTAAGVIGTVVVNSIPRPLGDRLNPSTLSDSLAIGAFDDGTVLVSDGVKLSIIEPRFVILAEEGREQTMRFSNWDLPGILQETAATRLIEKGIAIGRKVVITGDAARCENVADLLRTSGLKHEEITIIKPSWKILAAYGRNSVRKVVVSDGTTKETMTCDCVVSCGPIAPRTDIARQLGCEVTVKAKAPPRITADESFETSRKGVFAVGGSVGILDDSETDRSADIAVSRVVSITKGAGP